MTVKRLINPRRRRKVPPQFSWVDHRLVRDGHIKKCTSEALALYLFLLTVGDADGLSYYSDTKISDLLSWQPGQLTAARRNLTQADLIAWRAPLYQVLNLEPEVILPGLDKPPSSHQATPVPPASAPSCGSSRSIGEIFVQLANPANTSQPEQARGGDA